MDSPKVIVVYEQPESIKLFQEAVKKAQMALHNKGLPYIIADNSGKGCLKVFPDGHKVFVPYTNPRPF
jgi:hypothetical protein